MLSLGFGRTHFKGKARASGVVIVRGLVAHELAKIEEVFLIDLFFPRCNTLPLADEFLWSDWHGMFSLFVIIRDSHLSPNGLTS